MPSGEQVLLTFEREAAEGRHDPASVSRLTEMRPHLARAGLIASRLGLERARGALDAMTALRLPAGVLDRSGRLREANSLMTQGLVETRGGGRIVLGNPAGEEALAAILSGASALRTIALPATATQPGRVAQIIPLAGAARDVFAGNLSVIVMNVVGSVPRRPDAAILRAPFDLSPAERRLAACLASGSDLAPGAKSCGVRVSTARSYLEQIFRKTGVHRQAELVALMAGGSRVATSH